LDDVWTMLGIIMDEVRSLPLENLTQTSKIDESLNYRIDTDLSDTPGIIGYTRNSTETHGIVGYSRICRIYPLFPEIPVFPRISQGCWCERLKRSVFLHSQSQLRRLRPERGRDAPRSTSKLRLILTIF